MRVLLVAAAVAAALEGAAGIPQWDRFEGVLRSGKEVANASTVEVKTEFRGPDGAVHAGLAFWDGGRVWKFRFSPGAVGKWTWSTRGPEKGLTRQGSFVCTASKSHGPVVVSADKRRLSYADGTPFFWYADTAWNGPLLATDADWKTYLTKRKAQGFTAIQWVATHWRGSPVGDLQGRMPYSGANPISIDNEFFDAIERRHEAILRAGMVSVPVMLWAIATPKGPEVNPGLTLSESDAVLLARYMQARWGSDPVVWLLNGDGDYRGPKAERWKRIGRGVFEGVRHAPVSLHPGGLMWVMEEFRGEKWLDIAGYQSAHSDSDRNSTWITTGPPSLEWKQPPVRPVISLEAPYDKAAADQEAWSAVVRRNHMWSLLSAPVAGITYGVHGVWGWSDGEHPAPGHGTTVWPHWQKLLDLPGATQVAQLCGVLRSMDWTHLAPAPEVLAEQPGASVPAAFVSAAQTESKRETVVYTPKGGEVKLRRAALPSAFEAEWVKADSGARSRAEGKAAGDQVLFATPAAGDWVLLLRAR